MMPSYVTVNYNCIVFTPYIDQMNEIIEKISWSKNSYWGEPDKFKFKAGITSFTDTSEFEGERIIKNTFDLSSSSNIYQKLISYMNVFRSLLNLQPRLQRKIM